jgi:hypothetical protein
VVVLVVVPTGVFRVHVFRIAMLEVERATWGSVVYVVSGGSKARQGQGQGTVNGATAIGPQLRMWKQ